MDKSDENSLNLHILSSWAKSLPLHVFRTDNVHLRYITMPISGIAMNTAPVSVVRTDKQYDSFERAQT